MQFAHPKLLFLLLILIPLIAWYVWMQRRSHASLGMSSLAAFKDAGDSWRSYLRHICFVLKLGAVAALIIVLARPQTHDAWRESSVEGTDIVLAIDTSSSMLARDFEPDRLGAAKEVAIKFINGRENDNMGIVIFAGESLTGVPMTTDRGVLINYVSSLRQDLLEDGTAIGDGIATAINRIKDGKAVSKSIILLTDGSNNTGVVAPLTAAEIAAELGIKVYTIGVGTNGTAPYPQIDYFGRITYVPTPVVIDEATLRQIASMTGGQYFRATDNNTLGQIFDEIDRMETTVLDVRNFSSTHDDYLPWAILALVCFSAALLIRHTLLRSIP